MEELSSRNSDLLQQLTRLQTMLLTSGLGNSSNQDNMGPDAADVSVSSRRASSVTESLYEHQSLLQQAADTDEEDEEEFIVSPSFPL